MCLCTIRHSVEWFAGVRYWWTSRIRNVRKWIEAGALCEISNIYRHLNKVHIIADGQDASGPFDRPKPPEVADAPKFIRTF